MTALREAVVLPCLFLTVSLAAALRPGDRATVAPPTPGSLVVAVAILALLVRSGALVPERLMHNGRSALANLNGLSVLGALFLASAQVVGSVVPESGVPAVLAWTVLLALVLQSFVMTPDRQRLLRGLMVTFGAAFVLKFVVLAAISSPAEGRVARALQLLFEGLTLGAVSQRPPHAAEAYLAFGGLALYLIGVALLPAASWEIVRVPSRSLVRSLPSTDERHILDAEEP